MDNSDLSKLKIAPGKLLPKFKASTTEYSVIVASTVTEVKLSPLTSDSGASYVIKGAVEKLVKLTEGQTHTVEITVTAEDGVSTRTYSLLIRRLSADDASLSQLDLSVGVLQPAFSPLVLQYNCYLPSSINNLSIRAKTEDEAMRLSMNDGSPVGTVALNPGRTLVQLSVGSVNGKSSTVYTITVVKNRLPVTLQLKNVSEKYECAICCGVVACPSRIKDGPYVYCLSCLKELTRTNKMDPFTGRVLGEEQWLLEDNSLDATLAKEIGVCPLPSAPVEDSLENIGTRLLTERLKVAQSEEPTTACPDCSKKVPTDNMTLHKEKICSAKHTHNISKQQIQSKPWEKSMVDDSLGSDVKQLLKKAEENETLYCQSLPKPGRTQQWVEGRAPLDHLQRAAKCYASALKSSPRESKAHLGLGLIMEEFFYAEDFYGLKKAESSSSEEGEAEQSSKEEEFLAICRLHGVSPSAPLPVQLKAIEAEYHSLKDAKQTHKAEHVQSLHAWKSKKILQASQGSYSVDSESPLYKARAKLLDAVSSDPTNALSCYQLGRLCLLLGEEDEAVKYLQTALSLKPTHSEARYCLGLVVKEHVKPLLLHGLSEYLRLTQEVNENHPNPSRRVLTEINSKTLYRSSNPLVVDGFLRLAKLGGAGHLSSTHCLHAVTSSVGVACLQHRGSTYDKLLWASLQARSALLTHLHTNNEAGVLRHCTQLSGLLSLDSLPSSPSIRELQMKVFELGVVLQPSSSEALCRLGNGQLAQYDATNDKKWLEEAESSFRASIAMEEKPISPNVVPTSLSNAQWWKKREASQLKSTSQTKQPATGKQSTPTKAIPTKTMPAKTTPSKVTPAKSTPIKATPAKATPAKATPAKATPAKTALTKGPSRGGPPIKKPVAGSKTAQPAKTPAGKPAPTTSPSPNNPQATPVAQKPSTKIATPSGSTDMNKRSHIPRMGLARMLARSDETKWSEAQGLYREVIAMAPTVHDAYIELGEMLAKSDSMGAVAVYSQYPFTCPPSFDDAFLHGEIVRLLMSTESYDDPRLANSMIAMGQALGIGVLEKRVTVLENKYKSALLKKIYAGVHGKPVDDPDLQAFFKFKCWL